MQSIFFYGSTYIIPNMDTIVCGGTAQKDDWNTKPSEDDTKIIMDDIINCFPSMKEAPVVRKNKIILVVLKTNLIMFPLYIKVGNYIL